jgi:hypothetical protein
LRLPINTEVGEGLRLTLHYNVTCIACLYIRLCSSRNYILNDIIVNDHIEDSTKAIPTDRAVFRVAQNLHKGRDLPDVITAPPNSITDGVVVLPGVTVLKLHTAPYERTAPRAILAR